MSQARVQLQPGFVLHSRPYRDSSLLLDVLTVDYGRVSLLARGQRQLKARQTKPLQPFTELLLSWQGKTDLKSVTASETKKIFPPLIGRNLYAGFYVNELILRLVPQYDECPELYRTYQHFIADLSALSVASNELLEPVLRKIEFEMLDALGYGVSFIYQGDDGEEIVADKFYVFNAEVGFLVVDEKERKENVFIGREILAIADHNYRDIPTLKAAKKLARLSLAPHVGNKPLKSRELFKSL